MSLEPHQLTGLWFCSFTLSHLTQILAVTLAILEAPLLTSWERPRPFSMITFPSLCVCVMSVGEL